MTNWINVENKLYQKGWHIVKRDYKEEGGYLASCSSGHYLIRKKKNRNEVPNCPYCRGIKATYRKVIDQLGKEGYTIIKGRKQEDNNGNIYFRKDEYLTVKCSKGHLQNVRVGEWVNGKRCSACKGTRGNTRYSRSEEIIAGILDYLDVEYRREVPTSDEYGRTKLDFFLPKEQTIIEYDGMHHSTARSDAEEGSLEKTKRRDRMRDKYAEDNGLRMVRVPFYVLGKRIVYELDECFPSWKIDVKDSYYDEIVRRVYNYGYKNFGWNSYEKIKKFADICVDLGLKESHKVTGRSEGNLQRDCAVIYGVWGNVRKYKK